MNIIKPVYAQIINPVVSGNKDPKVYFNNVIQAFISVLFIFGIIYFVYHFMIAGYKMISSQGDPKKYEEAKNALLYSLVGIVIILSIFAILKVVGTIFGITGLNNLTITWPSL